LFAGGRFNLKATQNQAVTENSAGGLGPLPSSRIFSFDFVDRKFFAVKTGRSRLTQRLAGVKLRRVKLIVLGSGTSVPHPRRCSPAYWLATDEGTVLLDIGGDAPHRMAQEELDWPNLDAIWISHFHLDHLGGLAPYLFGARWAPQMNDRRKPLGIFGPHGLAALIGASPLS